MGTESLDQIEGWLKTVEDETKKKQTLELQQKHQAALDQMSSHSEAIPEKKWIDEIRAKEACWDGSMECIEVAVDVVAQLLGADEAKCFRERMELAQKTF